MSNLEIYENREELRNKQKLRAKKWGIEIRSDGHLTKPAEWSHLSDNQFADPVNYMYPVHDAIHARAALVYFIRYHRAYKQRKSRLIVLTRILEACIRHGVKVNWDTIKSNFPGIANLLPKSVKSKLVGYKESEKPKKSLSEANTFMILYDWFKSRGKDEEEALIRTVKAIRYLERGK